MAYVVWQRVHNQLNCSTTPKSGHCLMEMYLLCQEGTHLHQTVSSVGLWIDGVRDLVPLLLARSALYRILYGILFHYGNV